MKSEHQIRLRYQCRLGLLLGAFGLFTPGGCSARSEDDHLQPVVSSPVTRPAAAPIEPIAATAAGDDSAPASTKIVRRNWTDRTGKFHASASLLDLAGGKVRLQAPDKVITVPLDKLADQDFAYLAAAGVTAQEPRIIAGKVVGVHDGDTLTVLDDHNRQYTIRLAGIDAPERKQANGQSAREALAQKVFQQNVRIEWREHDRYGRTVGDLYLNDRLINTEMVAEGWAWHFRKYSDSTALADAERTARKSSLGLWAQANPVAPWDFRQNEKAHPSAPPKIVHAARAAAVPRAPVVGSPPASVSSSSDDDLVQVRGYTRKDGTYVQPHTRHKPSK